MASEASGGVEDMEVGVVVEDFLQTGRTGRRNAMADITDPRIAGVSTAGVDFTFDKMSMSDPKGATSNPSKCSSNSSSDSKASSKS